MYEYKLNLLKNCNSDFQNPFTSLYFTCSLSPHINLKMQSLTPFDDQIVCLVSKTIRCSFNISYSWLNFTAFLQCAQISAFFSEKKESSSLFHICFLLVRMLFRSYHKKLLEVSKKKKRKLYQFTPAFLFIFFL